MQRVTIRCAYGTEGQAQYKGSIRFKSLTGTSFVLHHVLYAPQLQHNLLSADMLRQEGYFLTATKTGWTLLDDDGRVVSKGMSVEGEVNQQQFRVTVLLGAAPLPSSPKTLVVAATVTQQQLTPGNLARWHQRLAHAPFDTLRTHQLATSMLITAQLQPDMDTLCQGCVVAKARQHPFKSRPESSKKPLDFVHADLLNPMVKSWDGKQ